MQTNKRKEKISAFLDNDIHRDALMSFSLSAEKEDAATVRRYQMIGDTLRGEMSDSSFVDVSHAVRDALRTEATYNEDAERPWSINTSGNKQPKNKQSVSDAEENNKGFFGLSAWFKPVAGMAVAASVAMIMVVSVSEQENTEGIVATNATNATTAVVSQPAVQVAIDNKTQAQRNQVLSKQALSKQALSNQSLGNQAGSSQAQEIQLQQAGRVNQKMNRHVAPHLVNQHLEYATQDTLQGRMPLVRAVSYESAK